MNHCSDCGLCCQKLEVIITWQDVKREPKLASAVRESFDGEPVLKYLSDKKCPMLSGCSCTIHETKPRVCRSFRVGSRRCNELRQDAGLSKIDPGIGNGSPSQTQMDASAK